MKRLALILALVFVVTGVAFAWQHSGQRPNGEYTAENMDGTCAHFNVNVSWDHPSTQDGDFTKIDTTGDPTAVGGGRFLEHNLSGILGYAYFNLTGWGTWGIFNDDDLVTISGPAEDGSYQYCEKIGGEAGTWTTYRLRPKP